MGLRTLRSLGPQLRQLDTSTARVNTVASRRITGRALQARRLSLWTRKPYCAMCGRLLEYPDGFELDHVIPLYQGGEDAEGNCQLLDRECHLKKTEADTKVYGPDPNPR